MKTNQQKEPMEQKPEVTETVITENAGSTPAQNRALKHWKSYNQYRRKTTVEGWHCGGALEEVRKDLPHGEWGDWLKSAGITRSTADRLRLLSKSYDIHQVGEFDSVDQALAACSKRKKAGKKVEPDVETKGEASSVEKAEVTGGEGAPRLPVEGESPQEVQKLHDQLQETEKKLRKAEEKVAELRETKDQLRIAEEKIAELLQENKQLKSQLEEKETPEETTSVDQQQIYPHSAFPGNSKDPDSDRGKDDSSACSGETPTIQHPETAIPVNDAK